ncbi:glycosyltransferase family 1 protein [Dysgonomonas sp. 520]|uniref:glycosyltransferase family 4 protein n=1 Tax=Dysgonomonas sp. 520 TaxID=2302931 RepID=UPI0013D5CDAC|nr:glycosyltransferase family 1 protein [Dysgonomonas sp. 520]NDW10594.1 glycosyltransferase family 1 protein [Dysgonomonas sp. 520]
MNRVRILYDYQTFFLQRFGGISRYFTSLIFDNNTNSTKTILPVIYSENEYLKEKKYNLKPFPKFPFGKLTFSKIVNKLYSIYFILSKKYDIFHPTECDTYFLRFLRKPLVITVHDMIYEMELSHAKDIRHSISKKKKLIEKADRIIAISQSTKENLLKIYPNTPKEKISVVHHGCLMQPLHSAPSHRIIQDKYILFVGARWSYKNFERMLKAIAPILQQADNLKLVCTGTAFNPSEMELIDSLQIEDKVVQMNVDDNTLAILYTQAEVFVFPSIHEGFGFPILEAFFYGTPVCLSNCSCFPEIAGNAAIYFDPYDEQSIHDSVKQILDNPDLAKEYVERGKKRLENFSIEKMIAETEDVYKSTLKGINK